jgi:hypothetical protein
MRRFFVSFLAVSFLALSGLPVFRGPARAQGAPPHAWLFGSWTGGLFPVPSNISAQACLAAPVVIFTNDVVLRASLTEATYTQRVVETARTVPGETDFRFAPSAAPAPSNPLLGNAGAPPPSVGFGCGDPDSLRVVRRSDNEIEFPGCADFPNPLIRCPGR